MPKVIREIGEKFGTAGEMLAFLWHRKLFWMIPLVSVLLLFGLVIMVGTATGVSPFIYTLF
jgi:hypothetical protein